MSLLMIGLIGLSVAILIGIFYLNSSSDRKKKNQAAQLAKHADYVRRFQRLIDHIPSNYLSRELATLILNEIISHLRSQIKLDSKNKQIEQHLERRVSQLKEYQQKNEKPTVSEIDNADDANEVRKRLMDLFKFVQHAKKVKKISAPASNKELLQIKSLFLETAVTLHVFNAKASIANNKNRLASYHYNRAAAEYQKSSEAAMHEARIAEYKKLAKHYEQKDEDEKSRLNPKSTNRMNDSDELSAAIDGLLAEESSASKRKF